MRVLGVLLQLACYVHFSQAMKSSCMAPPVRLGDEARLSCHFEEDISKVQHDVLVYLYKGDTEHPVVMYTWHDGQAKIHTVEGYLCEGIISDYLVIKIMNVNESNAGEYRCLVVLSKDPAVPCMLNIIDVHSSVKMSSFMTTKKYALQAHNIFDERHKVDEKKLHIPAIVLGVVFGVLVVTFLTILIIAIYKRLVPTWCCTQCVLNNSDDDSINNNTKSKKDIYKPPALGKTNIKIYIDQQQSLLV